jgi:transposase
MLRVDKKGGSVDLDDVFCAGKSRGGLTTKIHACVNEQGLPVHLEFTPGQRNDIVVAEELVTGKPEEVVADKAYDSDKFIATLEADGIEAVIPPKSNRREIRPFNKEKYKNRHLVENFFCKIKGFRRIATRYDHTIKSYRGFVEYASALLWVSYLIVNAP